MVDDFQQTLKGQTYTACEVAAKATSNDSLKAIVKKLDTSSFGYIAHEQSSQFLGYLVVDQERDRIEKYPMPMTVTPLEENERIVLASAHAQFQKLNEMCLDSLTRHLPDFNKILDPYKKFDYKEPSDVPLMTILDAQTYDNLSNTFAHLPSLHIILDLSPRFANIPMEQLIRAVVSFEKSIIKDGLNKTDKELMQLIASEKKDSPKRTMARYIIACLCLKTSLSILDQMLFQSVLRAKQPFFNEDNVINISNISSNIISSSLLLEYQWDGQIELIRIFDIVLAKFEQIANICTELWRVEFAHHQMSQEFGSSIKLGLRNIDNDLNPYDSLFKHI